VIAFDGVLHDGRSADAIPVRVLEMQDDIAIADGTVTARVPRAGITADAPIPGVPRMLRLPDGERIETADHAGVAALWPERDIVARAAWALESHWWAVGAAIAVTVAGIWLVVVVALPLVADPVARRISPNVERYLGEQALASLDRTVLKPSKLPVDAQREWSDKFDAFVAGEQGEEKYEVVFRRAGMPNAFALPGGTIVVTDEMVAAVASDDELLAVLAHEIGHVRNRHAMRLVLRSSGVAVLLTALAGDAVGVTFLAVALPTVLLQSGYSRQFEAEADDYAFAHMKRHGVSPQAFANVMRRLEKETGGARRNDAMTRYLGTHPGTEERIRRAEEAK
jgi:Zn-dependent protease with chaperone function